MNQNAISRAEALRLLGAGVASAAAAGWGDRAAQAAIREGRADTNAAAPPDPATILTRPIPASGETLPIIGLGTWQTFDVGATTADRAPLEEVLTAFAALGGKVIDSSPMYGRSEEVVGDLSEKLGLRSRLFVATKVWTTGKTQGVTQMEDSIRKLHAGAKIDLMQVHNLVDVETHLATLREWKQAGRIRYIGVTHYNAAGQVPLAKIVASQKLDFIQINYSVAEREAERTLLPLARDHRVAVLANRPLAGGDLLRRLQGKPLPSWAAEIDCVSWPQVLLKFVVSHPAITCAIPGTAKVAHLRDNMQAAFGRLPDEALRARIAAEAV